MPENEHDRPTIHTEILEPVFPLDDDSPTKPEIAGGVTLRSRFFDGMLSVYVHAPITRLNHEGKRIDDISVQEIRYNIEATDLADMENEQERDAVRSEIIRLLSLAGDEGRWQSGVRNIRKLLDDYEGIPLDNREEFERLVWDAVKYL